MFELVRFTFIPTINEDMTVSDGSEDHDPTVAPSRTSMAEASVEDILADGDRLRWENLNLLADLMSES